MTRAKYDLLEQFPFSVTLKAISALGRLAQQRLDNGRSCTPCAVPIGAIIQYATPLDGWITRQQAHTLAANLQQRERELKQEKVKNSELEARLEVARSMMRSGNTAGALADLEGQYMTAFKESAEVRQENQQLHSHNATLLSRLREAEVRLARWEEGPDHSASHGGERIREERLAELLRQFLPNLDFIPGSAYFLVLRVHNRAQTVAKLRELNDTGRIKGAIKVQKTEDWFEAKFGKNGSTVDRMYYSRCPQPGRSAVKLSDKRHQDDDLREISRK